MSRIKIRNLDTDNYHRIRLIKTESSLVDVLDQYGAVWDNEDSVHICLSPQPLQQINCDNATGVFILLGEDNSHSATNPLTDIILKNLDTEEEISYVANGGNLSQWGLLIDYHYDSTTGLIGYALINSTAEQKKYGYKLHPENQDSIINTSPSGNNSFNLDSDGYWKGCLVEYVVPPLSLYISINEVYHDNENIYINVTMSNSKDGVLRITLEDDFLAYTNDFFTTNIIDTYTIPRSLFNKYNFNILASGTGEDDLPGFSNSSYSIPEPNNYELSLDKSFYLIGEISSITATVEILNNPEASASGNIYKEDTYGNIIHVTSISAPGQKVINASTPSHQLPIKLYFVDNNSLESNKVPLVIDEAYLTTLVESEVGIAPIFKAEVTGHCELSDSVNITTYATLFNDTSGYHDSNISKSVTDKEFNHEFTIPAEYNTAANNLPRIIRVNLLNYSNSFDSSKASYVYYPNMLHTYQGKLIPRAPSISSVTYKPAIYEMVDNVWKLMNRTERDSVLNQFNMSDNTKFHLWKDEPNLFSTQKYDVVKVYDAFSNWEIVVDSPAPLSLHSMVGKKGNYYVYSNSTDNRLEYYTVDEITKHLVFEYSIGYASALVFSNGDYIINYDNNTGSDAIYHNSNGELTKISELGMSVSNRLAYSNGDMMLMGADGNIGLWYIRTDGYMSYISPPSGKELSNHYHASCIYSDTHHRLLNYYDLSYILDLNPLTGEVDYYEVNIPFNSSHSLGGSISLHPTNPNLLIGIKRFILANTSLTEEDLQPVEGSNWYVYVPFELITSYPEDS